MRKQYLLVIPVLSVILFQNFASFDIVFDPKYKVNDEARRNHAKELLGNRFKKSLAAEQSEDEFGLSVEVFNLVERHTPRRYHYKVEKIAKTILEESNKYNVDPVFVASVIRTESAFNPLARGTSGEIGLMQLMPKTAEYIARRIGMKNFKGEHTLKDPVKNIKLGVAYLDYLRQKFGNQAFKYVPAYNMGPGNVKKTFAAGEARPKVYSARVIKYYESFYRQIYVSQMFKSPNLAQK
jgi:soluble lytic murein transglycosylase